MEFKTLLKQFGEAYELAEIAPEEDGICRLSLDDNIIDIKADAKEERLLFFAEIAPLPLERREEMAYAILGANYLFNGTNGATLAISPENETVYLQRLESLAVLDVASFSEILNDFANTIEQWKKLLADFQHRADNASPKNDAPDFPCGENIIRL